MFPQAAISGQLWKMSNCTNMSRQPCHRNNVDGVQEKRTIGHMERSKVNFKKENRKQDIPSGGVENIPVETREDDQRPKLLFARSE
ncbi:hypothetical protein TNIN_465391 [Trichonephila inaurata madagascariensis]|uniref:Uncharacterized protein n=1 Tax=Trichonephila inaurata madagascariensis TaxID=2747483 RepID=A0A8X6X9B1_9ARAC|nr:hypothetical protein TNIN_465391 [Trichonephila inaurata madagascariensis]